LTSAQVSSILVIVRNDVRQLREGRGLSQAALGDVLGVSRQTVNSIENGRYNPTLPLAIAIARYFGLTVEEVFHVDG
jgi:putative transcriptional regulator